MTDRDALPVELTAAAHRNVLARLDLAILATPTGDVRNAICDAALMLRAGALATPAPAEEWMSHAAAWRRALVMARDNATSTTMDSDNAGYWQHEINALDAAATPTPAPSPAETSGSAAMGEAQFHFWMGARRFSSARKRLTGGEIKAISNTSTAYSVYRDTGPHFSTHEAVGDGELTDVDGGRFYALIPATMYRGISE